MVNVLLQSRADLFTKPGGDTTQINELHKMLNRAGVKSKISIRLRPSLRSYQIVHIFNVTCIHEIYVQMRNAKKQKKHVIFSPIYQELDEYNRKGRFGLGRIVFKLVNNDISLEYLRAIFKVCRDKGPIGPLLNQWRIGYRSQQSEVLSSADKVIFGSKTERDRVFSRFSEIKSAIDYDIVSIGIPHHFGRTTDSAFREKYGISDFVLCAARIEDLKNQWGLLQAMKNMNIPVVLIGFLNRNHSTYCKMVLREVEKEPNFYYLGPMKGQMLRSAFASAKVHALPSWFETTGLTSLEAGLAGCNVVSTNRGYAQDYLEDFAWYCDPSDWASIQNAVTEAYDSPRFLQLAEHIKENHNIGETANRLAAIYESVFLRPFQRK